MVRSLTAGAAFLAILVATQAQAQSTNQAILYSNGHFKRQGPVLDGPTRLYTPFVTKSVRIPEGSVWEICSGNTFTGCREITQSVEAMVMTVRSARPVASVITTTTAGGASAGPRGAGASLRGLASEYFVAPDQSGNRVVVQPGTSEAMTRAAIEFCRTRGWRSTAHARLQSIGGQFYLADVLCVNE